MQRKKRKVYTPAVPVLIDFRHEWNQKLKKKERRLGEIIGKGSYGTVYQTDTENLVAKVIQYSNQAQLDYMNKNIKLLFDSHEIREHLPFFTDDERSEKMVDGDWYFAPMNLVSPPNRAILYMEKMKPIQLRKKTGVLDEDEKQFVNDTLGMLERLAAKKCFFPDFKLNNYMQRNRAGVPNRLVFVDLDSLKTFDSSIQEFDWQKIDTMYNVLNLHGRPYNPPSYEEPFNNSCLYLQRVSCLCTLADWASCEGVMRKALRITPEKLASFPNIGKTKNEYIVGRLNRILTYTTLLEIQAVASVFEKIKDQHPFNVPFNSKKEIPEYGEFYIYRSSFTDRTLLNNI